jgi:formylglycine-generating enzyme required for sulfatase activity
MAYNLTLETRDGDKPITWSLESGTLPTGLSLAETGVIYGTPTAAGTSAFALKATNAVGNHAVQTSMTITASINRIPIEMVQIPAGTFMMGSPDTEPGRFSGELQHQVTLTTGFRMGKYPVTQAQYQAVTGMNPSLWRTPVFPETNMANRPVEFVSWYEAVEFCNKLSIQEGLTPVYTITDREPATGYPFSATVTANWSVSGYRLPTEAQWEYACRAGTTTAYNTGDNITADQANYIDTMYQERTTEVGSFAPNAWGLHDMHGNVNEWCWDLMDSYGFDTQTDPTGPAVPPNYYLFMIFRGGCFLDDSSYIRSARRNSQPPLLRWGALGFRVVRPL